MTSRLKKKLNDLGVDPTSSKANESFCLIGTPLPPLEKSKDTGEFVPLWKQEVRDEKGRRRLHGAFTGGFSAGYFNTVGSKEGWAPSTFVSSRSDRAKAKAARPEDFMDEEDLAELRESRKLVDENEEMDFGGTEAELRRRKGGEDELEKDPITAALEASLAPAPKDSVGARILKKMGWRPGKGIGPRLTYAQHKALDSRNQTADEEEDEEAKKHLYPRRDTPVLLAPRKDNFHGLGYIPGQRLEESVGSGRNGGPEHGPNISAGFGLGALNDADEDDLDVYDSGKGRQSRSKMAYDIVDEDDSQSMTIGSANARQAVPRTTSAPGFTQTFSDGRPVLRGFVLSDRPVAEDRWFPLPEIPKSWTPNPRWVWEQEKNKENIAADKADKSTLADEQEPRSHANWKSSFKSADERGSMLGETPLLSKTRSIFEYMSQKDRERLQNIKNAIPVPSSTRSSDPSSSMPPPPTPHIRGEVDIPYIHPSVAKAALQGFQPFVADPVKQSRYTAFLNFQSNRDAVILGAPALGLEISPMPGQSVDEFNKELDDYAKSATVFKPLSGAMASRFRPAVVVEMGPKTVEGLHQPTGADPTDESEVKEEEKKEEDPKMGAVRLGMYGPLTRDVQPWQPARLLCKRFGVKDPEVDMTKVAGDATMDFATPTVASKDASGMAAVTASDASSAGVGLVSAGAITDGSSSGSKRTGPRDLANIGLGEDDDQGRDTLTYQRPAMDIFKAIFASDEEDSDDEDADDAGEGELTAPTSAKKSEPQVKSEDVPMHLRESGAASTSYEPTQTSASSSTGPEKVDLASFKLTFVPRSERELRKDKGKDRDKRGKDKKKANKATLSFDVEEDGFGPHLGAPIKKKSKDKSKDKERKKKRRKEQKDEEEDDSMWVEAPPPEVLKNISVPSSVDDVSAQTKKEELNPPRGRKRAIDFM